MALNCHATTGAQVVPHHVIVHAAMNDMKELENVMFYIRLVRDVGRAVFKRDTYPDRQESSPLLYGPCVALV